MQDSRSMAPIVARLKRDVQAKDFESFRKNHFALVNTCRKLLFGQDRQALARHYASLSDFYTWFYRSNRSEWPEVERFMGGVEILLDLARTKLDTRQADEVLEEVNACQADRGILGALSAADGVLSPSLADALGAPHAEIETRLKCLEEMGLVQRLKRGSKAVVFLTPRGRTTAADLGLADAPDAGRTQTGPQSGAPNDLK